MRVLNLGLRRWACQYFMTQRGHKKGHAIPVRVLFNISKDVVVLDFHGPMSIATDSTGCIHGRSQGQIQCEEYVREMTVAKGRRPGYAVDG